MYVTEYNSEISDKDSTKRGIPLFTTHATHKQ